VLGRHGRRGARLKPRSTGPGPGRSVPPFNSAPAPSSPSSAGANDLPGGPLIPVRFRSVRPGRRVVPPLQAAPRTRSGQLHGGARPRSWTTGSPTQGQADPGQPRNYLGQLDVQEGKGPIYMMTTRPSARSLRRRVTRRPPEKKLKELESEAWEDKFLDMTISQAILWAASNISPRSALRDRGLRAVLHRLALGRQRPPGSAARGPAVGGQQEDYFGLLLHVDGQGPLLRRRRVGRLQPQVLLGLAREGRIRGKAAIKFIVENNTLPKVDPATVTALKQETWRRWIASSSTRRVTDPDVNPNFLSRRWRCSPAEDHGRVRRRRVDAVHTNETLLKRGSSCSRSSRRTRRSWRRDQPRADALLGERAPHVAGRGARAHGPLPRGDAVAGYSSAPTSRRWIRRLEVLRPNSSTTEDAPSGR